MGLKDIASAAKANSVSCCPCTTCACPYFFQDPYGNLRCGNCKPPPHESMVRKWFFVAATGDPGSPYRLQDAVLTATPDEWGDVPRGYVSLYSVLPEAMLPKTTSRHCEVRIIDGFERWDVELPDGSVVSVQRECGEVFPIVGMTVDQSWDFLGTPRAKPKLGWLGMPSAITKK